MANPMFIAFWKALNEYAEACGGDTTEATMSDRRQQAVASLERIFAGARAAEREHVLRFIRRKCAVLSREIDEARRGDEERPEVAEMMTIEEALTHVSNAIARGEHAKEVADG